MHAIASRRVMREEGLPVAPTEVVPHVQEVMLAGVYSGLAISTIVAPMEGIKARLQVGTVATVAISVYQWLSVAVCCRRGLTTVARLYQVSYAAKGERGLYRGPIDCIKQVVTGPLGVRRGLYRGWVPTALCRMSNWSYFGRYASLAGMRSDQPLCVGSPPLCAVTATSTFAERSRQSGRTASHKSHHFSPLWLQAA